MKKNQKVDAESLFLAEFAEPEPENDPEIPIVQMRLDAPSDKLTPMEFVYRCCDSGQEEQVNWLKRKFTTDLLRNFVAASNVSPMTKKGFVGFLKTYKTKEVISWVVQVNQEYFKGRALKFVANMGDKLVPFPLLELNQAVDWLKENESATYEEWRKVGMFTPAHVLDSKIGEEPFTLIANGDIVNILEASNLRAAKYIVGSLTAVGCSVLLLYSDVKSIHELEQRQLFYGLQKFWLGEF